MYLAPVYLTMICFGIFGLVMAPRVKFADSKKEEVEVEYSSGSPLSSDSSSTNSSSTDSSSTDSSCFSSRSSNSDLPPPRQDQNPEEKLLGDFETKEDLQLAGSKHSKAQKLAGIAAVFVAGFCVACQLGLVTIGRHYEEKKHHCSVKGGTCPKATAEQFNNFGSWMASFGIGALVSNTFYYTLVAGYYISKGQPVPTPGRTWQVMKRPGTLAGLCWCLGNFFNTAAVVAGGNAIVLPISLSTSLITGGLWGLLYYKEVKGKNAMLWVVAAAWTLTFMVLISFEKGK